MTYEFTPEYEIGIKEVDDEHRKFFEYINAGVEALDLAEEDSIIVAKNLLKKLNDYAEKHFEHEEAYMKDTHDSQLLMQMRYHQDFRDHVKQYTDKEDLTKKDLGNIFVFMAKWLKSHILTSDMMIGKIQNESLFVMTEEFYTGVDIIDEEHKKLFEIIGRAYDIVRDEFIFDKYDAIVDVLNELKEYTQLHFADEEAYMERINYKGLAAQKIVHDAFIEKIVDLDLDDMSSIDEDPTTFLSGLMDFLTEWLIHHILKMDKKIPCVEE